VHFLIDSGCWKLNLCPRQDSRKEQNIGPLVKLRGVRTWMEQACHALAKPAPWIQQNRCISWSICSLGTFPLVTPTIEPLPDFTEGIVWEERNFFSAHSMFPRDQWGIRQMQSVQIFSLKSLPYRNLTFLSLLLSSLFPFTFTVWCYRIW
jgi:hypothetical protein